MAKGTCDPHINNGNNDVKKSKDDVEQTLIATKPLPMDHYFTSMMATDVDNDNDDAHKKNNTEQTLINLKLLPLDYPFTSTMAPKMDNDDELYKKNNAEQMLINPKLLPLDHPFMSVMATIPLPNRGSDHDVEQMLIIPKLPPLGHRFARTMSAAPPTDGDSDCEYTELAIDGDQMSVDPKLVAIDHFSTTATTTSPTVDNSPPLFTIVVNGSCDPFHGEWPSWNARCHMKAVRRWLMDMEWNWGSMARWPAMCEEQWAIIKTKDHGIAGGWIAEEDKKVAAGRLMLWYLGRIMEGQLPLDVEELRDLYLQGHQLTCDIDAAIIPLEQRLYAIKSECEGRGEGQGKCRALYGL